MKSYIYHIDCVTHAYTVAEEETPDGYFYAVRYHPTIMDIKLLRFDDLGKTWFYEKEACLDARIARLKRELELEIDWKNRKNN